MGEDTNVVNGASVQQDATPVETTTEATSTVAGQTDQNFTENSSAETENQQGREGWVPKDRMDSYRLKAESLETKVREYEEKARLFDALQKNPELASGYLKNMPAAPQVDPMLQSAVEKLRNAGVATVDVVDKVIEERLAQREQVAYFRGEVKRLAEKYNGSDGLPAFDAEKVGKYIDDNGYYRTAEGYPDLEKAFRDMHEAQFIDAKAKQAKSTTFTERGSAPIGQTVDEKTKAFEAARKDGNFRDYLGRFFNPYNAPKGEN